MDRKYQYSGCFIKKNDLAKAISVIQCNHLDKMIEYPHITFAFMPDEVDENLFGEKIDITVLGYGNDGKNEGLLVDLSSNNKAVNSMISQIPKPHITISISSNAKAIDTRFIEFDPVEPIELTGVFGAYSNDTAITEKQEQG